MRTTTTDFEEFINWQNLGSDDFEEIEGLFEAVRTGESGEYAFERDENGRMFVRAPSGKTLLLVHEAAREAFISYLRDEFASGHHGDITAWAAFERAMANPNA